MTKYIRCFFLIVLALTLSGCPVYQIYETLRETRFRQNGTNIIGIAGEPSDEPYIEIRYSVADGENHGFNKTDSFFVSPPYIFQNDDVYITYEYVEVADNSGPLKYIETLLSDYDEGGAEYLRIINHSLDKPVEFFIAGSQMPHRSGTEAMLPSVRYKNAPVYFLLNPDERGNLTNVTPEFEGDRCGDLTLTEAWTVDEVVELYRAEYARSLEILLTIDIESPSFFHRMIDFVEGKVRGWESFQNNIFYGTIEAGGIFQGSEKVWLIALPGGMFISETMEGSLR